MIRLRPAIAAALTLAIAASVARAQARTDRPRQTDANYGQMIRESPVGLRLSNRDVEEMSPIKALIDKRKDLKLTDDQHAQLKTMNDALKESNKPHFAALDSLRSEFRPRTGTDPEVERIRTQIVRETVVGAVRVIRESYAAALPGALEVLDADQKARADDLIAKHAKQAQETLTEKLGAGRGGRGAGSAPAGRGRPPAA